MRDLPKWSAGFDHDLKGWLQIFRRLRMLNHYEYIAAKGISTTGPTEPTMHFRFFDC